MTGRDLAKVHPGGPRKGRNVEAERDKRSAQQFIDHHPLARLYRAICYINYAREEKQWYHLGFWANDFASAFANLDPETQSWLLLQDLLPGSVPDCLGGRSTFAWIAYLASLRADLTRWQRLREAVSDRIVAGWGAGFLPTVLRPVSSWDYTEPPF